ncbi:hypothetical protein [Butyrivibrio fibrisolvens]|uniref:hypothetical protein n=1 Tax=Butyrivibrio fibrisolvens TaxID=831 RepID=UPI0018AD5ACE|nr:hypothetical protein [Butyrivibrio fibrisolvens]
MSEEEVVYYGAPTLAGLKTGNLISCPYESRQKTMDELRALNDELVPKGIYSSYGTGCFRWCHRQRSRG